MKILQKIMTKLPLCYQSSIGSAHPCIDIPLSPRPARCGSPVCYADLYMGLVQPRGARYTTGKRRDYSVYIRIWKCAETLVRQQFWGCFQWLPCRNFATATASGRAQ